MILYPWKCANHKEGLEEKIGKTTLNYFSNPLVEEHTHNQQYGFTYVFCMPLLQCTQLVNTYLVFSVHYTRAPDTHGQTVDREEAVVHHDTAQWLLSGTL